MTNLPYEIVDVFTDRPFTGNPLAVVFEADGLTTAQLQAVAREFNLSETVFVLPPTQPEATYRARIFTPAAELPFAGHPSIGAAVTVARGEMVLVQECGAGLLPLTVLGRSPLAATLTGGRPTIGPELPAGPFLAVVGLTGPDLAGPPPRSAGCGLEFPFLLVHPDALAQAALDPAAIRDHGIGQLSVFAWDPAAARAEARVFAPGAGVAEDPATGSAALGLGVWLVASGLLPGDGESSYQVHQGAALGRPSRLDGTVTAAGGATVSATVTGSVVPIASGRIAVPPAGQESWSAGWADPVQPERPAGAP